MKRAICLVAVFIVTLSLNIITVSAETNNSLKNGNLIEIQPFWVNASTIDLGISFSGTTASCSGRIKGYSDVNKITATFILKRVN